MTAVPRTGKRFRTNDGRSPVKKSLRAASRRAKAAAIRKLRRAGVGQKEDQ